ncbi:MAG TPA: hypothetical protein VGI81_17400 [Tepidisphaeraceae bacterium]|jgi:hypothetical protein
MRAPWKRAAAIALATCGFSALPFINGCKTDVEAADAKVAVETDKAVDALQTDHPQAAREAIETAAASKSASPDVQIQTSLLAAQADLDAAGLLMSGPGPSDISAAAFKAVVDGKAQTGTDVPNLTPQDRAALRGIEQRQNRVEQLLSQIASVAGQMALNNINVAGFKALEPTKAREALRQAANDAQKGNNGAWVAGTAPIPSLEGLKAREQDLQKQIGDLTAQRDDLNAKRGQALQQAAKFGQQADSTTGSESVGFFTQGANQRKEAADDEVKIAQLEAQLAPLQQDLQLVQLQQKTIGDVLATYADQTQQIESGWKNVQQRIDQASALTKTLLEGNGGSSAAATAPTDAAGGATAASTVATPRSLSALATELDNETKELQALRGKVVALLNSASKHFEDAATTAATLTKNLNTLVASPDAAKVPDRRAWQERISLNSPAVFKLGQAAVQNRFARLYTDAYAELARRNQVGTLVADALKGAGIAAPQSVAAALPAPGTAVSVDAQLKQYQGDLKSDSPPFQKDASELNDLANAQQTSPAALQAVVATQADVAYHWAASLINDASNTAGSGEFATQLANVCHAALMTTNYGQAQFYLLQGKQQEGAALMKAATDERDKLAEANAQGLLPAVLPVGLAFEAKPAPGATTAPAGPGTIGTPAAPGTSAPATQPTEATPAPAAPPARAPADGTAPTPGTTPATPGTTPPTPGTTPPTPGTTPPAEGTTPAPGTTPPPAPAPGTPAPAK